MVSIEFDASAVGSNCSWWANGGAGMVTSPFGTLVGAFDIGAGLSIGGVSSVVIYKTAPTGTQPLISWHGAMSFGLAEPFAEDISPSSCHHMLEPNRSSKK